MARRRPTEPTINPARGIALVVGAVVIGLLLLRNGLDTSEAVTSKGGEPTADAGSDKGGDGGDGTTTTTAATVDAGRPVGEISVIVLNGTSVTGAAGKYSDALGALGYQMAEPATSTPEGKTATTQVFFTAGFDKEAVTLAASLGLPATVASAMPAPPPGEVGTANIAVVIGDDIASLTPTTVANTTTTAAN